MSGKLDPTCSRYASLEQARYEHDHGHSHDYGRDHRCLPPRTAFIQPIPLVEQRAVQYSTVHTSMLPQLPSQQPWLSHRTKTKHSPSPSCPKSLRAPPQWVTELVDDPRAHRVDQASCCSFQSGWEGRVPPLRTGTVMVANDSASCTWVVGANGISMPPSGSRLGTDR